MTGKESIDPIRDNFLMYLIFFSYEKIEMDNLVNVFPF